MIHFLKMYCELGGFQSKRANHSCSALVFYLKDLILSFLIFYYESGILPSIKIMAKCEI
jgi:hypothetical protein